MIKVKHTEERSLLEKKPARKADLSHQVASDKVVISKKRGRNGHTKNGKGVPGRSKKTKKSATLVTRNSERNNRSTAI